MKNILGFVGVGGRGNILQSAARGSATSGSRSSSSTSWSRSSSSSGWGSSGQERAGSGEQAAGLQRGGARPGDGAQVSEDGE